MKFNLSVCLLFLSLYGLSQALPVRPWSELRLQRSGDEIVHHVFDNEGVDVFSVHAEPRELGKHLLVELAGDHVQIDNRAAFENGARKTNTNFRGLDLEAMRGKEYQFTLDVDGTPGVKMDLYFEGRTKTRSHYYKFTTITLRGKRRTYSFAQEIPEDALSMHLRFDFLGAGVFKMYGATVGPAQAEPEIPKVKPELLFHASFDGTLKATTARGNPEPVVAEEISYDKGVFGKAVKLMKADKSSLAYELKDNVDPVRGTISLWYKPLWRPGKARDYNAWRNLFGFERKEPRIGSGAIWLWYWDTTLRGDLADEYDSYKTRNEPFRPETWRHVAFTWNEQESHLYLDGKPAEGISDGYSPLKKALQVSGDLYVFNREDFKRFFVGSMYGSEQADGLIDDLKVYSAPLSAAEVASLSRERAILSLRVHEPYQMISTGSGIRFSLANKSGEAVEPVVRLLSPSGVEMLSEKVVLKPGETREFLYGIDSGPGRYVVKADLGELSFSGDVVLFSPKNPELSSSSELDLELVDSLDLSSLPPSDRFASVRETRFGSLGDVKYLEANSEKGSRYALRFVLPEKHHLYCFEFDYPDDARRTCDLIVQTSKRTGGEYELQTGYACGDEYPSTNKIVTMRCLYWCREQDISVIAMTARAGEPAALSAVRLYKVKGGLPPAKVNEVPVVDGWNRSLVLYYEDPAINYDFVADGGKLDQLETLINRTAAYMKYSGQNLLAYPGAWYHGLIGEAYNPRTHAPQFLKAFYVKFDQEGLSVMPTINQNNMPVPEGMITRDAIKNGLLHSTPISIWSTGKPNPGGWHNTPPNFNILHPDVQQHVLDEVNQLLEQGKQHPSFKGIVFHITRHCLLWLGDINAGYNDYAIDAFSKDTGIQVPRHPDDPMRGKHYADWILANHRDKWIEWRCQKVADFYAVVADRLAETRKDLKLVLNSFMPADVGHPEFTDPDFVDMQNRRAGLDARLFKDKPNIVLCQALVPADYRWRHQNHYVSKTAEEHQRVLDTLPGFYNLLNDARYPWVHMHDRYWESAIGKVSPNDKVNSLNVPWLREHHWRVTTINPAHYHAMRHYVLPLRYHDLMGISKGGFLVGTYGMEEYLVPFAKAFRALPAKTFQDHPASTSLIKARTLDFNGQTWLYVVNTSHEPADFAMDIKAGEWIDLVTGDKASEFAGGRLVLKLEPYQLRSFAVRQ